ncbi:MAG: hydrocarbon-binding protein [Cyanobacteria bacterium P01_C01_bin.38]
MLRQELGDFSSIICFKAAITGMEEALGEKATAIALIAAGRSRGKNLAKDLGLSRANLEWSIIANKMDFALGINGTKLCKIDSIVEEGDVIKVATGETLCSAGEPEGSPRKCSFTLGAVWGALEEITGKRLKGSHTESILRGGSNDVFEFAPLI